MDFKEAYDFGTETKIITKEVGSVTHVLVPPNCKLQSMEKLMEAPIRIRAHPEFDDVDGFADYVEEFKDKGSRIFVDEKGLRFVTIFDSHAKGQPAWCDHSASYGLSLSDEWKRFCDLDGQRMSPIRFAEFIEDNLGFITAKNLNSNDLLAMAQTYRIKVKGNVEIKENLHNGQRKLMITDDSTVRGEVKGNEVKFPEQLTIKMRVFKNCDRYSIPVYLRYRSDQDSLELFFKIQDPDGIVELAFDEVIANVKKATGLKTLKGSFQGPDHRS